MKFLTLKLVVALMLSPAAALLVAAFAVSGGPVSLAQMAVTPTPALPPKMGGGTDWILLDNVPPGSPQIEYGREIYRLACSACHGYEGQGLTTEWRMTWAPEDQNCWQSKCHGPNHPPDGFFLPYSPPITNLARGSRFPTALELQDYIRKYMPWQDPGSMLDERAWQVTAYVLKLNKVDAGPALSAETAAKIRLAPETVVSSPNTGVISSSEDAVQGSAQSPLRDSAALLVAVVVAATLLSIGALFVWRRGRS